MSKAPKKIEVEDVPTVPTDADIARGDAVLKRMLQTKPKPHKEMVGKQKTDARRKAPSKAGS